MKILYICLVLNLAIVKSLGLQCYVCDSARYFGEAGFDSCFQSFTVTNTSPANNAQNKSYCYTEFTLHDDLVTAVRRGYKTLTNLGGRTPAIPLSNCSQDLNSISNIISRCTLNCDGGSCNSKMFSNLKPCTSNCSRINTHGNNEGTCDYIDGRCVCNNGRGNDCSEPRFPFPDYRPTYRKCVQCSSAIDGACATETVGHDCESPTSRYCSATRTSIYDSAGNIKATTITRGCTTRFVATDRCKFTSTPSSYREYRPSYREYTCYSTCDTDNCNINMPNGIVDGTEKIPLRCCTSTNCGITMTCNSTATHCLSRVVYEVSNITDSSSQAIPEYRLISEIHGCSYAPVTRECTEIGFGDLTFRRVTCQETCQKDNCNTGWPARPTCFQCSLRPGNTVDCLENPGSPSRCPYPYQAYCAIKDRGLKVGTRAYVQGYPRQITRGCSYLDIGSSCESETIRGITVENCNYSCTTDGCNVGSGGSILPCLSLLVFLLPLVSGPFLQSILL